VNESLRGFRLDEEQSLGPPEVRISGQSDDHSNTPIIDDGIGYIVRGEESHQEEGFVIFLDALGMKGIWQHYPFNQVVRLWRNAIRSFMDSLQRHQSNLNATSRFRVLSDTIIITIPTTLTGLNIGQVLLEPFITSIKNHMLFRGTISYGQYFISPRLLLGPALDEAAAHNNKLDWIGIALTPELAADISSIKFGTTSAIWFDKVPHKNLKTYRSAVLDWPQHDRGSACNQILQNKYRSSPDKEKYRKTFEFHAAHRR
jgi:hypothetical protein